MIAGQVRLSLCKKMDCNWVSVTQRQDQIVGRRKTVTRAVLTSFLETGPTRPGGDGGGRCRIEKNTRYSDDLLPHLLPQK